MRIEEEHRAVKYKKKGRIGGLASYHLLGGV